ncbi:MAG: hypothetical protein EOP48_25990, partial [Sphingobacteriales bacterium]
MKDIPPVYNFTTQADGEFTKFIYKKTPISFKAAGPLSFYCIIPAGFFTMMFHPSSIGLGLFIFIIIVATLSCGVVALINASRQSDEIAVSRTAVILHNKTYQLDHVSSFLIKDPTGGYSNQTTIIYNSHNPFSMASNVAKFGQGLGQAGRESRLAFQQHIRDVSYKIVIQYG